MGKEFIALKDGNKLAYQIYGDGKHTLVLLHGLAGSSWLGGEWIEAIKNAGVRCIAFERPGYGDSSPMEINSVSDWIAVFAQAIEQMSIKSADVIGCSAGAPYAYAAAYGFPGIISRVWNLGGVPAVYLESILNHYSPESKAAYNNFLSLPLSNIQEYYSKQMKAFAKNMEAGAEPYLINTIKDACTNNYLGMARESKLQIVPWGFEITSIEQPVVLWHAKNDEMVPYEAVKEMAQLLKKAEFHTADESTFRREGSIHIKSIEQGFFKLLKSYM